jgi:putative DNA primase/helicase
MISIKEMLATDHLKRVKEFEVVKKTSTDILREIIEGIEKIDFKLLAFADYGTSIKRLAEIEAELKKADNEILVAEADMITKKLNGLKLQKKHYLVDCIGELIKIAENNNWGLCKKDNVIFLYNGEYWEEVSKDAFQFFLGSVAFKMGVNKYDAKVYNFKEELFKQFLAEGFLESPKIDKNNILINLENGTFEINGKSKKLREFRREDFLTHQLPFKYNPEAEAPIFLKYLNEVLPDTDKQKVLAEFIGYVFTKGLKLEKALVLYGTGANGKSVFFEVLNALLGSCNVSNYSIESLTTDNNYSRAEINNKLVNYSSEISSRLDPDAFKLLTSIEPIQARLPYGVPFLITDYAKLIFNCNELPKETEHTNGYFRRFLIVGFDETIPESKQDKKLHTKIIDNELSGVFNWVLKGLDSLLENNTGDKASGFSNCEAVDLARLEYERSSDNVLLFLQDYNYTKSTEEFILTKNLYFEYKAFCYDNGFFALNVTNFNKRLLKDKVHIKRNSKGYVAYLNKGEQSF